MGRDRTRVSLGVLPKITIRMLRELDLLDPCRKRGGTLAWSNSNGENILRVQVVSDLRQTDGDVCIIGPGDQRQHIAVISNARHFGGRQWYFICPRQNRKCSVLYKPPGSPRFYSRQFFGRQVAYLTQSQSQEDRAYTAQAKIVSRFRSLGGEADWNELRAKPKRMRWLTFNAYEAKMDNCDAIIGRHFLRAAERIIRR